MIMLGGQRIKPYISATLRVYTSCQENLITQHTFLFFFLWACYLDESQTSHDLGGNYIWSGRSDSQLVLRSVFKCDSHKPDCLPWLWQRVASEYLFFSKTVSFSQKGQNLFVTSQMGWSILSRICLSTGCQRQESPLFNRNTRLWWNIRLTAETRLIHCKNVTGVLMLLLIPLLVVRNSMKGSCWGQKRYNSKMLMQFRKGKSTSALFSRQGYCHCSHNNYRMNLLCMLHMTRLQNDIRWSPLHTQRTASTSLQTSCLLSSDSLFSSSSETTQFSCYCFS